MGSIALAQNNYGKSAVRLVAIKRGESQHTLRDLTVDVALEGDFFAAHFDGDNRELIATDTMRNAVYVTAKEEGVGGLEAFGAAIGRYLLSVGPRVQRARVQLVEHPWARLSPNGEPHPHAFQRAAGGERVATVTCERDRTRIEAGVQGLGVLRTTGSGWADFLRDRCATLADTDDRILATTVSASWSYADGEHDFDALWEGARTAMLDAFADHYSPSVQFTLRRVGEAVLAAHAEIEDVHLSLPNQHHIVADLRPFGLTNDNEVFYATTEPYGLIEGTITRTENR